MTLAHMETANTAHGAGSVALTSRPAAAALPEPLRLLEAWLETQRVPARDGCPGGYGGPVAHWWRDSLDYTGPGFDWRYEGIIYGYLALYERTGAGCWLQKATRAGDDLLAAQLPNGHFLWSQFEQNPGTAGTPHESAVCSGLLALARVLRDAGQLGWERFLDAARRNLDSFAFGLLWDAEALVFRDDPAQPSCVPNKVATHVEALFRRVDLTGEHDLLERYARPSLDAILRHQVRRPGDRMDGAIAQNSFGGIVVHKYFPYYVARCIPALLEAAERLADSRYLEAALAAGQFICVAQERDGGLPQVLYSDGRMNRYPRWIAAVGDVLRALELLLPHGLRAELGPLRAWLMAGQLPSGAFATGQGFGAIVTQRRNAPGDTRDTLGVVGWNDKAFRYLASADTARTQRCE